MPLSFGSSIKLEGAGQPGQTAPQPVKVKRSRPARGQRHASAPAGSCRFNHQLGYQRRDAETLGQSRTCDKIAACHRSGTWRGRYDQPARALRPKQRQPRSGDPRLSRSIGDDHRQAARRARIKQEQVAPAALAPGNSNCTVALVGELESGADKARRNELCPGAALQQLDCRLKLKRVRQIKLSGNAGRSADMGIARCGGHQQLSIAAACSGIGAGLSARCGLCGQPEGQQKTGDIAQYRSGQRNLQRAAYDAREDLLVIGLDRQQRRKQIAESIKIGGLHIQRQPGNEVAQHQLVDKTDVEKEHQLACPLDRRMGEDRQLQNQMGQKINNPRFDK